MDDPGLPLVEFDGPEAGDLAMAPAQFGADATRRNYWWLRERRTQDAEDGMLAQLSQTVYGDPTAWMAKGTPDQVAALQAKGMIGVGLQRQASIDTLFADVMKLQGSMPGEFANLPASHDALKAQAEATARREIEEELADYDNTLANRSDPTFLGGLASFGGSMGAGVTDVEGVATLPLAINPANLGRSILLNGILGGGMAALDLPGQNRMADFLGEDRPDPIAQIIAGAGFGAALPIAGRAVHLGVNALTPAGRIANRDLLGWGTRPDATAAERGAANVIARDEATLDTTPEGMLPDDHAARVEAGEAALQADLTVRPGDVIPDMNPAAPKQPGSGAAPRFDYDPGGNAAPDANLVGYVLGKLIDRGMEPAHALGVVANGMVESGRGLNTGAIGDNGNAIGILQWNGPRRRALLAFAEKQGKDWRDVDVQIDFLFHELDGPEYAAWQKVLGTDDPAEAARMFSVHFERPGVPHLSTRMAYARMLAEQFDRGEVPKAGAPGKWRNPGDDALAADVVSFDPRDIETDALTYQYKAGGDDFGVTDRLRGERSWDAMAAAGVIVHERMDGRRFIADGHQRFGLARRLMDQGQNDIVLQGFLLKEIDGYGPEEVRALAALRNIRQESGSPLDAAKIIRDNPELVAQVSRGRAFMAQAQALADLAPGPFQAIVNDVIPQNWGAIVGRVIPEDDRMQGVAIAALKKADPANETQAESIVRDIRRLGLEKRAAEDQLSLFGDGFDLRDTVISERARIIDRVMKEARTDRAIFNRLDQQADIIEEAGNVLNRTENTNRAEAADRALARLLILADQPGPVRDALDIAARDLRGGKPLDTAARDVWQALGRPADAGQAGGPAHAAGDVGAAAAKLDPIPPTNLLDLPPVSDAAIEPGLFDDIESPAEAARLDGLNRQLTTRLAEDPQFDLAMPTGPAPADGRPAPTISLRALMDDLNEEADFADALKTLCLKGP